MQFSTPTKLFDWVATRIVVPLLYTSEYDFIGTTAFTIFLHELNICYYLLMFEPMAMCPVDQMS